MILELCDDELGKSLLNRFTRILPEIETLNKDVIFVPEAFALRYRSERASASRLEFISFYRTSQKFSWARQRTSVAREGIFINLDSAPSGELSRFRAVPADLTYDVIYWTKEKRNSNAFIKEMYFWIQENPNLTFSLLSTPVLEIDMHFGDINETETDWFDAGRYFKATAQITLDAWLLKDFVIKDIDSIHLDLYVGEYKKDSALISSKVIR